MQVGKLYTLITSWNTLGTRRPPRDQTVSGRPNEVSQTLLKCGKKTLSKWHNSSSRNRKREKLPLEGAKPLLAKMNNSLWLQIEQTLIFLRWSRTLVDDPFQIYNYRFKIWIWFYSIFDKHCLTYIYTYWMFLVLCHFVFLWLKLIHFTPDWLTAFIHCFLILAWLTTPFDSILISNLLKDLLKKEDICYYTMTRKNFILLHLNSVDT